MLLMPPEWEGAAPFPTRDPQRCCDACAGVLEPRQAVWVEERANATRRNSANDTDAATRYLGNSPYRFTLGGEIRKAAYSLRNLSDGVNYWDGDAAYFDDQLAGRPEGLAFLTVAKIACVGGVRVGTGLVVARLRDGSWSAPCAIGSYGVTFGAVFGAEVTDMITPLDGAALQEICDEKTTKATLGGEASLALGPLGRTAGGEALVASDASAATATSYSQSRGFYGGVTLDGAYVTVRDDVNLKFYGRPVTAARLLGGLEKPPTAAAPLYDNLHAFYAMLEARQADRLAESAAADAPQSFHSAADGDNDNDGDDNRAPHEVNGALFPGDKKSAAPPSSSYESLGGGRRTQNNNNHNNAHNHRAPDQHFPPGQHRLGDGTAASSNLFSPPTPNGTGDSLFAPPTPKQSHHQQHTTNSVEV